MRKISWYIAGAALGGVALFMFRVGRDQSQNAAANAIRSEVSGEAVSASTPSRRSPPWRLAAGTELVYRLDYRGEIEQLGAQGHAPSPQILKGTLHVGVLAKAQEDYEVRVWIEPVSGADPEGEATLRALGSFVQDGVEGRLASRGFDLQINPESSLPETQRGFWQSLFDRMAAPVNPEVFGQALIRSEKFGGVSIESNYQWQCVSECAHDLAREMVLTRTIGSNSGAAPGPASGLDNRTVEGSASITFRPGLQGISKIDVSTVETIGPMASGLKIKSRLNLAFVEEKYAQSAAWSERGHPTASSSQAPSKDKGGNTAIDQAVIAHIDEGAILAELRQHQDLTELPQGTYLKLKSWIALHPESLPKFTQMLAAPDASETVLRSYIKALGAVGHRGAQDAMVEVMQQRAQDGDDDTVDQILTGFTLVKDPSERAEKALRALALSESAVLGREKAKLALGAIGYHLRQSTEAEEQGRALALEKDLGQWLAKAQDREAKEAALGALGNLGPTDIGFLSPYMASEDPGIRARAYFALRFSPADGASQVLADGLVSQTSAVVRRDALEALAMRPKDKHWLTAVENVPLARLESGEKLLLGRSISTADDLDAKSRRAMLERLEAGTKDPEVRQALNGYMQDLR